MNARLQSFFDYEALEQRAQAEAPGAAVDERRIPDIEPAIRQRIQLLIRNGKAQALVPLEDEAYCGHCHRRLTPREAQLVKSGDVIACEHCNRIVYRADAMVAA